MPRRLTIGGILFVLLAGCGADADPPISPEYQSFREQPTACDAEPPDPVQAMAFAAPGATEVVAGMTATLHTSCGDIVIELRPDLAPVTVASFVFLAEQGYFDGTVSHRIAPGFVVQFGDPTATGRGGPGYRIPDELPSADFSYDAGVVAMANSGPDSGGSQFFIALEDIRLDPDYAVFGRVAAGGDVLARIAAVSIGVNPATGERSYPLQTLYVEAVTITR